MRNWKQQEYGEIDKVNASLIIYACLVGKIGGLYPKLLNEKLMVKKFFIFSLVVLAFLAACQSTQSTPTELATEGVNINQPDEVTPSSEPPPLPEVSPTPTTDENINQAESNCTVVSRQPTPGPTEQSLVPPVSETDWSHGPEDAKVTIIEYGDFQ